MSDNFHQSVNAGTGANHIMLGHGDAICSATARVLISHEYTDHVSILKFIERNWNLKPVS